MTVTTLAQRSLLCISAGENQAALVSGPISGRVADPAALGPARL